MAIPQILYGNGGPYIQGVDDVLSPVIIYYPPDSNDHYTLREMGTPLSIHVNATSSSDPMTELELMELSNGCKIVLEYRLFTTDYTGGITYHFTWKMKLLDMDGVTLRVNMGGRNISKASIDPNDPFGEMYMTGGRVSYGTNRPTIAGEPANQYYPFCSLFTIRPNQLTPEPFVGDSKTYVFEATWTHECYLAPIGGETEYNNLMDDLVDGGDGSDPVSPTPPSPAPDDPAGSDDTSTPGGGGGNYDDSSDPIDFPPVPTGGALDSGAVVAHRVANTTIKALMLKLWDDSIFNIGNMWQKSIQDPMNAIVSMHAIPVSPEVAQDPNNLWIGNFDTQLNPPLVTNQYVEVDCGSITTREFWGSALDYSPYTNMEIFLPFIGVKKLKTEDAMKTTIHIKYYVDVLTGDCVAFIKCGMSVLYHFTGNCRMGIPLSSLSSDLVPNLMRTTGGLAMAGAMAVGGGFAGAAMAGATGMGISAASNVASSKVPISRSGDMTGNAGIMNDFVPYLIIHRPQQSLAKNYNKFKGYTSNITERLGNCSGYTEVEHIHLQGIPNATNAEMDEIERLLKGGVLI